MLRKIVSGGQTGADRAALDFAISYGIPHGGWIPKGRLTEEGPLDAQYILREMPTESYPKRTEQNVIDSDGTLIVSHGNLGGGSELTAKFAAKHKKPWLHIDLDEKTDSTSVQMIKMWVAENNIVCLNVAGPRASGDPRIYKSVRRLLEKSIAA